MGIGPRSCTPVDGSLVSVFTVIRMKKAITLILSLLLMGCSAADNSSKLEAMQKALDLKDVRVREVEAELQRIQETQGRSLERERAEGVRKLNRSVFEMQIEFEKKEDALNKTISQLTADMQKMEKDVGFAKKQVMEKDKQITSLKMSLEKAREKGDAVSARAREEQRRVEEAEQLRQRLRAESGDRVKIHIVPPPPTPIDISSFSRGRQDLFPIHIYDVRGERIVRGERRIGHIEDEDETYRDRFGNTRSLEQWVEESVNEYVYVVTFSASNKTSVAYTMHVRAGEEEKEMDIVPGGVMQDLSVDAAVGAALRIFVNGATRTYTVTY